MRIFFCLFFLGSFSQQIHAQAPSSWSSSQIYLALQKLKVLGSVLYVAAHPDDENTRLITYFSKEKLYRTAYLSMTRGDGGQNLIGDEQGIELGLIRTQELLAARRIDGGEQFFTRAFDFGFSKTPEETFTFWDKQKILSDVVWVIRNFKPDIIITRFPTTGEGGHGHHTASAILANEAFAAAANVKMFPEQLKYVKPWKTERIFFNGFNFGGNNTTANQKVKIDIGNYSPLLGKSFGEIAAESRSQHKSQGFGSAGTRGESMESFSLTGGSNINTDILEGIDIGWGKIDKTGQVEKMIQSIISKFDLLKPQNSVKDLVQLYKNIAKLPNDDRWVNKKLNELQDIIMHCSGLYFEAVSTSQTVAVTDSFTLNVQLNNRLGTPAALTKIFIQGKTRTDSIFQLPLLANKNYSISQRVEVAKNENISQPYWLVSDKEMGYFNVSNQQDIGKPDAQPIYTVGVHIAIEGQAFTFTTPVMYKYTDPVKGEIFEPLVVVPTLIITPGQQQVISGIGGSKPIEGIIDVQSFKKNEMFYLPQKIGIKNRESTGTADIKYNITEGKIAAEKQKATINFSIANHDANEYYLQASGKDEAATGETKYDKTMLQIHHNHIPQITYFKQAVLKNTPLNIKIAQKNIAYITGAGDKVPEGLEQMGYEVTLLNEKNLAKINLSQFDAILTGIRAYNTHEWMNVYYNKLMNYVNEGGNLIVQYNTSNRVGPVVAKIGPYGFDISRDRVTNENAEVRFVNPKHPVMHFPNEITAKDFEGWIQERSIYHASNWEKDKFETIFSMNDINEKPNEGSLIVAKYGKGFFTYTGLVFFREIPAGVGGAYRLLANLIALNTKPF